MSNVSRNVAINERNLTGCCPWKHSTVGTVECLGAASQTVVSDVTFKLSRDERAPCYDFAIVPSHNLPPV